jgi:hypothetical protein
LHADEAYYWVYSKYLDWGYFDHPPMVAVFIKIGDFFNHSELSIRMIGIIANTLSIYFLWLIVKKYSENLKLFIVLFLSVLIFHVYSFIITPDSPLFFFAVSFLLVYQKYLEKDDWKLAALLGLICAGLLLSKYHGILIIFFVLISNPALFLRKSFWFAPLIAILAFFPHLYWQYENGFPTIHYHLFDRSASSYKFEYTAQYFLDQVLMMGPLVGWLFFYFGFKQKTDDKFIKALKFIVYGVLIFFFLSTFKGRVQAHWPLIEFIPLFILAYIFISRNTGRSILVKYKWLFVINIVLILLARFLLISTPESLRKVSIFAKYNDFDIWAEEIKEVAGDSYVVFQDGFQEPSLYNFHTNSLNSLSYNSVYYRKNQYDLWPIAQEAFNKRVLVVTKHPVDSMQESHTIHTIKGDFYGTWIDNFQFYPLVNFIPEGNDESWHPSQTRTISFVVENKGSHDVDFLSLKESLILGILKKGKLVETLPLDIDSEPFLLKSNSRQTINFPITAPVEKGKYKYIISIKTDFFPGTRNSQFIKMNVN